MKYFIFTQYLRRAITDLSSQQIPLATNTMGKSSACNWLWIGLWICVGQIWSKL